MKNLLVSASGGRTSMMMMKLLNDKYSNTKNILNAFANTGFEDEKTLEFVDRCSKEWGLNIIWVEAVVDPRQDVGTRHKIVDFETAKRNGEPFHDVCAKYGLPNPAYNHCNREMKLAPIHSLAMEVFGSKARFKNYETAIGIRVDEFDRMLNNREKYNIIYPFVQDRITKAHVFEWWDNQPFDLDVPEHFGNCITCFKKSDRKLATVGREREGAFDLFIELESRYAHIKAPEEPRRMFRYHRPANEIARLAFDDTIQSFVEHKNREYNLEFDFDLDEDAPCDLQCGMKEEDLLPD